MLWLFKTNFRGFRRFLIHGNTSYVVLYTQCLRYNICSVWFLDIRISTCFFNQEKPNIAHRKILEEVFLVNNTDKVIGKGNVASMPYSIDMPTTVYHICKYW